jgi:hypothetical protein
VIKLLRTRSPAVASPTLALADEMLAQLEADCLT